MEQVHENMPVSQLPQPTRARSPSKLSEMSAATFNARSNTMGPPINNLKRKTLADRAGETARPAPAPPTSRYTNSNIRPTTIANAARDSSYQSAFSRSTSAASSRHLSSTSFSSSLGPGSRPPSSQSSRPQSALGSSRIQKSALANRRPATSLQVHDEEQSFKRPEDRICRTPISSSPPLLNGTRGTLLPKVRKKKDIARSEAGSIPCDPVSLRQISLSTHLGNLSLEDKTHLPSQTIDEDLPSPSRLPKLAVPTPVSTPSSSPKKLVPKTPNFDAAFLTKSTNMRSAWDHESRLKEIESTCSTFREKLDSASSETDSLKRTISDYKSRVTELEDAQSGWKVDNANLQTDLNATKARLATSTDALDDSRRHYKNELDDLHREHLRRMEDARYAAESQTRKLIREQAEKFDETRRKLEQDLQQEVDKHDKELQNMRREGFSTQEKADKELEKLKAALHETELSFERSRSETQQERETNTELRAKMAEKTNVIVNLESSVQRLESHIKFLESDNKSQSHAFADLEARMQNAIKSAAEASEKLIKEETLRRKLHNQVQELKGNIRVFCRARPILESDSVDDQAKVLYPDKEADCKEIEVMGPEEKSSLGNITTRKNAFAFDRVFGPAAQNEDIFDEISQLVQSALDGYNVCIFCYGQTGSGKTFTMSANDGMIPRAVNQIYDTAQALEEKGWKYHMEGSFIEVYNENLNDLLGRAEEFDKKKHEIKHDLQNGKTTITGIATVELDSPGKVNNILARASSNRSVAATQANERSSRSHSVFILKLTGENSLTGERSEGTLNLVDLAGSERLSHSGATGERLKETQNINKSLSCLGDVIGALGQGKEGAHVPYRNSKLTYLLQNSLGGNSKTLMFVMISPLQAHLSETLTSLKFATKVHNTHIGTAKKLSKS